MNKSFLLVLLLFSHVVYCQTRINRLSLVNIENFYSLRHSYGSLNDVVRLGDGFAISFRTYDTVKRRGMKYEVMASTFDAYYNSASYGGSLRVEDTHTTINFIFPFLILYQKRMEQWFSVGIGIGTLAQRDYYDNGGNLLPYNSNDLQEPKFGQYWGGSLLLDYDLSLQWTKHIATDFGFRYNSPSPVHSNKMFYPINQGTAVGFKLGLSYKF